MSTLSLLPNTCALPVLRPTPSASRRLTDEQVSAMKREYRRGGISTTALAVKYGVSQSTAHRATRNMLAWAAPRVRHRGVPGDAELRALKAMLREYPNRWALVKQSRTMPPDMEPWASWGLLTEVRRLDSGWYGVYVSFPADVKVSA